MVQDFFHQQWDWEVPIWSNFIATENTTWPPKGSFLEGKSSYLNPAWWNIISNLVRITYNLAHLRWSPYSLKRLPFGLAMINLSDWCDHGGPKGCQSFFGILCWGWNRWHYAVNHREKIVYISSSAWRTIPFRKCLGSPPFISHWKGNNPT